MDIVERFRHRFPVATPSSGRVPERTRVYAIGDIHGCLDLLDRLHGMIAADAAAAPDSVKLLVYLGDYIDRGPGARQVVERLMAGAPPGFRAVYLRGNHEDYLLRFLTDMTVGVTWFRYGGVATLASYGISLPEMTSVTQLLRHAQVNLQRVLPRSHVAFLSGLKPSVMIGDYYFCHAGVRPGVPLDDQRLDDLLWIRDEFLTCDHDLGGIVVHGHTVTEQPDVRPNRIGIDTGAVFTGHLTCLVLEGGTRRFLQT